MAELAMCWLTDSGRLNRKVVTHPASSLAQDRESSPAETSVLTTMLRRGLLYSYKFWREYLTYGGRVCMGQPTLPNETRPQGRGS